MPSPRYLANCFLNRCRTLNRNLTAGHEPMYDRISSRFIFMISEFSQCSSNSKAGVIPQFETFVINFLRLSFPADLSLTRKLGVVWGLAGIKLMKYCRARWIGQKKLFFRRIQGELYSKKLSTLIYRDKCDIMNESCSDLECTNSRAVLESRLRVELQNQLRSALQTELWTLLTHLSQEVIKLLVARVSLVLWKLR